MKCNHCGAEIAADSVFCEHCGKKIKKNNKASGSRKKRLTIIIGGIAVVIIAGVLALVKGFDHHSFPTINAYYYSLHQYKDGDEMYDVPTYFYFRTSEDVIWLMGTPSGKMFPVGFGKYNSETNQVVFSASDKLNKKWIYDNDIVFELRSVNGSADIEARLISGDNYGYLKSIYEEGNIFRMSRSHGKVVMPEESLVGSEWDCDEVVKLHFVSWNEVVFDFNAETESCAYVCLGDMVAIASGDDFEEENMIGIYSEHWGQMTLCVDGLYCKNRDCLTFYRE